MNTFRSYINDFNLTYRSSGNYCKRYSHQIKFYAHVLGMQAMAYVQACNIEII